MTLLEKIKADRIAAMKAKNSFVYTILGTLLGEVEGNLKRPNAKSPDEEVLATIKKSIDAIDFNLTKYTGAGQIQEQQDTKLILQQYQPKQMTEAEIKDAIAAAKAAGFDNQGKINGYFKTNFAGKYDGGLLNALIKAA